MSSCIPRTVSLLQPRHSLHWRSTLHAQLAQADWRDFRCKSDQRWSLVRTDTWTTLPTESFSYWPILWPITHCLVAIVSMAWSRLNARPWGRCTHWRASAHLKVIFMKPPNCCLHPLFPTHCLTLLFCVSVTLPVMSSLTDIRFSETLNSVKDK